MSAKLHYKSATHSCTSWVQRSELTSFYAITITIAIHMQQLTSHANIQHLQGIWQNLHVNNPVKRLDDESLQGAHCTSIK